VWHHDFADEPVLLYSEVADNGVETRTIETYRDGHSDYADVTRSTGSTVLSQSIMPSKEEIDDQHEFTSVEIPPEEFEQVWSRATGGDG